MFGLFIATFGVLEIGVLNCVHGNFMCLESPHDFAIGIILSDRALARSGCDFCFFSLFLPFGVSLDM